MDKLGISKKLLIMLVVPVMTLAIFAGKSIYDRMEVVEEMEELEHLTEVALAASQTVHELQKERGLTAGYLASGGDSFASELIAQRAATDKTFEEFEHHAGHIHLDEQPQAYRDSYKQATALLSELSSRRDAVSNQSVETDEAIAYYSSVNNHLIGMVAGVAAGVTDAEIASRFSSYVALMLEKEYAGIERATLNAAFVADEFTSPEHYRKFVDVVAKQEAYGELFAMTSSAADKEMVTNALQGQTIDDHRRMRQVALDRAETGGFGVEPSKWFRTATARIDLLHAGEVELTESITEMAIELRSWAQIMLYGYAGIALVAILLAVGFAQLIARSISRSLTDTAESAQEIAQQIVATATQQSASASETATSVSQTSSAVDELRQTSEVASDRATEVRNKSERSVVASDEAFKAITAGMEAMNRIREEVEGIASNILELSEKNIQIGEIVESVNAIAEQSNLLAVNASIEAAQAGEHGKGFSVVASEVKALAGQSKEATAQIRSILSEIQKSSNAAVMVTEQGTKRVEESSGLIEELGQTLRQLGETIEESMEAAQQIAATADQQLKGIEEITVAITNIEEATRENAAGTSQLEEASRQVEAMSQQLAVLVNGSKSRRDAAA